MTAYELSCTREDGRRIDAKIIQGLTLTITIDGRLVGATEQPDLATAIDVARMHATREDG